MDHPWPLFHFLVLLQRLYLIYTVNFTRIRTWIIGVNGEPLGNQRRHGSMLYFLKAQPVPPRKMQYIEHASFIAIYGL